MKIRKAINEIKDASDEVVRHWDTRTKALYAEAEKRIMAFEMAIKALKALETIKKEIEHLEISGDYGKGVMDCYEIIIKAKEEVENV